MNISISTTNLTVPTILFAAMVTLCALPSIIYLELQKQQEQDCFNRLCRIESKLLKANETELSAAEILWRGVVEHKDKGHNWLTANAKVKLGDVLDLEALIADRKTPTEVGELYRTAAFEFQQLNRTLEEADTRTKLGSYFEAKGLTKDAEKQYLEARNLFINYYSRCSFFEQEVTRDLVELYLAQKRYDDAKSLLKDELSRVDSDTTPVAAGYARFLLGQVNYQQGNYQAALALFKQSSSPFNGEMLPWLAATYEKLGDIPSAEAEYRNIVSYERKPWPGSHPGCNLSAGLESLGAFYSAQNRFSEALPVLEEALCIRKQQLNEKVSRGPTYQERLGCVQKLEKQIARAKKAEDPHYRSH